MKIENLSLEEILERMNIQGNLLELQSGKKEKISSALKTLATISCYTDRKDVIYSLIGYYKLEIKTIDDIEFFFNETKNTNSYRLILMILQDLVLMKETSKRRIFMDKFLRELKRLSEKIADNEYDELINLINTSSWGSKQKNKFINELKFD